MFIQQDGVTNATVGGSSVATLIPSSSSGVNAVSVMITVEANCFILAGASGVTVSSSTGTYVTPNYPLFLNVRGDTHIAHIQDSGGGTISITAVGNG